MYYDFPTNKPSVRAAALHSHDFPGTFNYNGSTITVTTIETNAFGANYDLEAIVIGNGIQAIESKAIK